MENQLVIQLSVDELKEIITQSIEKVLERLQKSLSKHNPQQSRSKLELLNRKQVCEKLDISFPTLNKFVKEGRVRSRRLGKRVYFKPEDIEAALTDINIKGGRNERLSL